MNYDNDYREIESLGVNPDLITEDMLEIDDNNFDRDLDNHFNRGLNEMIETPEATTSTPKMDSALNSLIESEYNPKKELVRNETLKNLMNYGDKGVNFIDGNVDMDSFNEFKNRNEDFLRDISSLDTSEKINAISRANDRFQEEFSRENENKGKLLPTQDGYAIELDNGEIIYTDRENNRIEKELRRMEKEKKQERLKNEKLLNDEYNALLKRQEDEEKERLKILEEEEKRKKKQKEDIGKFITGLIGGVGINSLMNRR